MQEDSLTPKDAELLALDDRALTLRIEGKSFREIGKELGISHQTAANAVERALRDLADEKRDKAVQLRTLEAARLDELFAPMFAKAKAGSIDAAKIVLKIAERRAKLFGLDAPVKIDMDLKNKSDHELLQAAAGLLAAVGPAVAGALAPWHGIALGPASDDPETIDAEVVSS